MRKHGNPKSDREQSKKNVVQLAKIWVQMVRNQFNFYIQTASITAAIIIVRPVQQRPGRATAAAGAGGGTGVVVVVVVVSGSGGMAVVVVVVSGSGWGTAVVVVISGSGGMVVVSVSAFDGTGVVMVAGVVVSGGGGGASANSPSKAGPKSDALAPMAAIRSAGGGGIAVVARPSSAEKWENTLNYSDSHGLEFKNAQNAQTRIPTKCQPNGYRTRKPCL